VPGHEDICKPERPACNLSDMELSASVIGVRSGVMWLHFDDAKTSRAAAFITDCKRRARCNGMPANTALPVPVFKDFPPRSVLQQQIPISRLWSVVISHQ